MTPTPEGERTVSSLDEKKAEVKKLAAKALQMKMDLHDLSEELPQNWELIPVLAQKAHDAYAELESAREELKLLKKAAE